MQVHQQNLERSQRILGRLEGLDGQFARRAHAEAQEKLEQNVKHVQLLGKAAKFSGNLRRASARRHTVELPALPERFDFDDAAVSIVGFRSLGSKARVQVQVDHALSKRGRDLPKNPIVEQVLEEYIRAHQDLPLHQSGGLMSRSTASALEGVQLHDSDLVLDPAFERYARSLLSSRSSSRRPSNEQGYLSAASKAGSRGTADDVDVEPRRRRRSSVPVAQLLERKRLALSRFRRAGYAAILAAMTAGAR